MRIAITLLALLVSFMAGLPVMAQAAPETRFKSNVRIPQQLIVGGNLNNTGLLGPSFVFRPASRANVTLDTIIVCTTPAATRTYTIADAGASASFLMTAGNATITGVYTMTGANVITHAPTGLKIQDSDASHLITVSSGNESAARTLSIPVLGAADILMTTGTAQTIGGVKTFTNAPVLSSATLTSSSDTITIQDLGNANIVQSEGTQTINGVKTFGSAPTITGGLTAANIQTGSAKRQVIKLVLSPNTAAAADSTLYRGLAFPGRAGIVTRVNIGCQVAPTVGTDVIKVLKASSTGATMLSTATFDANTLVANTATLGTLTGTGADLAITATEGIYCEYSAGVQTVDAIDISVTIEFEPTDF